MHHDDWRRRASILAQDTSLSWREIARRIDKPRSTVSDYLRSCGDEEPKEARVLIFDIETAPGKRFFWSRWDKFTPKEFIIEEPGNILTWSAKWLGDDDVLNDSTHNYSDDPWDDFGVVSSLWDLLDECDIAVAHNGDKFDVKKMQTRFMYHGMGKPSPYKQVDTYKIAKRELGLDSAALDNVGAYFGLGRKTKHSGADMWVRCMNGDTSAYEEMLEYNDQDVLLLEQVYLIMRPYDRLHPNVSLYTEGEQIKCPRCASNNVVALKGKFTYTQVAAYQVYKCSDCGGHSRSRVTNVTKGQRQNLITATR